MAGVAGTVLTIKGIYLIGKDVYDRCQAIKDDFGDSKKRLTERLHTITANLKTYEELENEGKIRFQEKWSSDLTAIGIPANYLRQHLEEAKQYLEEFEEKWKVKKFLSKVDIEKKFQVLADDLRDAAAALTDAVQPLMIPGVEPKKVSSPFAEMNFSDLKAVRDLGSGGYGRVYLAEHKDEGKVAVKKFHDNIPKDNALREVKKMYEGINCQYLVNVIGYIEEPTSIIMEFCEYGNLMEFNKKYMMADDMMDRKVRMILDIAEGMNYLHTRPTPIYHLDLKLENVFVGGDFMVKIGDFGLAVSSVTASPLHTNTGTYSHVPPEAYKGNIDYELWDIYMFAITLFEFLSGQDPWPGIMKLSAAIIDKVKSGKRPDEKQIPSYVPTKIIKIMKKCWDGKPKKRPQFKDILLQVSSIYKTYKGQVRVADTDLTMKAFPDILSGMKLEPQRHDDDAKIICRMMAICDYNSKSGIDLSFNKGDVVEIIEETYSHLWFGQLRSSRGYVPRILFVQDIGYWEREVEINDKLNWPWGIALDHDNAHIAVADGYAKCYHVYNEDNKYQFSLGNTQELFSPWDITYCDGKYYATDCSAYVRCYNANDGKYCNRWLTVKPESNVGNDKALLQGICVGKNENTLFICNEYYPYYISKHTHDGKHIKSFTVDIPPYFIDVTPDDNLIISGRGQVEIVNEEGTFLHRVQYPDMEYPYGVYCHNDVIFVCDRANIYCCTLTGQHVASIPLDDTHRDGCMGVAVSGTKMYVSRGGGHGEGPGRVEVYTRKK